MIAKKTMKMELTAIGVLAIAMLSVQGCSLFSPRVANGPENANFRQTASVSSNPIPLPVEIVSDITTISSGGNIPQEGVWRPAYPEADSAGAPTTAQIGPDGTPIAMATKEVTMNSDGTVKESEDGVDESGAAATSTGKIRTKRRRVASTGGKTENYKVRRGDTLMKISFEKYGNIYRWREIYDTNKSRIANLNKLTAGTLLTIHGIEYIVIERNGTPYLIRRGDTLVKISKNVYNTPTEWKSLWKNNRQLIHDPNKIYAGFTMYYVPKKIDDVPRQVRQISTEKPGLKPKATIRNVVPEVAPVGVPAAGPETTEPESRSIRGVNLSPEGITAPAPAADGAWTASPATPMDAPPDASSNPSSVAPSAKP
ncbi:hypothetical protein BH10BDE1_BH10BDE1_17280 [soil metagenome]